MQMLVCALLLASEVPLSPERVGGINPEAVTGCQQLLLA